MMVLYPMLILPLFNKLEPLEEGDLKKSLMDLADRTGFAAQTIQVIDGSKRSTHSNAYFTGFGKFRRIVLYDTLIEHLSPRELMAVLAHEIGHYMGLYHPVEASYNYWDALEDTVECGTWNACETQLGNNLMFPYPICYGACELQTEITSDQMGVLQRYTGTL